MNLLIFGANWYNHGDESAIRAMIDELIRLKPDINVKIQFNQNDVVIPYENIQIINPVRRPPAKKEPIRRILYILTVYSGGSVRLLSEKQYPELYAIVDAIKWADLCVYAPGGPTIGDIYKNYKLLEYMHIMKRNKKPYVFYAPSMGPFKKNARRIKKYVDAAEYITFREEISQKYYREISHNRETSVTLDSAFQKMPSFSIFESELNDDTELQKFLFSGRNIIGVTITDLQWNSLYKNQSVKDNIDDIFKKFVYYLIQNGFGVLFIPQLFGKGNDSNYMSSFIIDEHCYMIDDSYDCYFQQCLISKLYAVVGMRYHSNIFSAKMGTPFVSIAYEQKMIGFMKKANLYNYCIPYGEMTYEALRTKFNGMVDNYDEYKMLLKEKQLYFYKESYVNTEKLIHEINRVSDKLRGEN